MELTATQAQRWKAVLGCLVDVIPNDANVLVDGAAQLRATVADRLAEVFPESHGEDVLIWLRAADTDREAEDDADIVLDVHDPGWPVLRRVAVGLAGSDRWYLTESRAFFGAKAATWDQKFGDDLPAYTAAVEEAQLRPGGTVVDVGCGTGRALTPLRAAVGPAGTVVGLDLTPEMLAVATARGEVLIQADACRLPFGDRTLDAIFAAGLLMHLPDPDAGLRELARVVRPGGRLVLFHPSGRAALAARHGRTIRPDEPLSEQPLRRSTAATGWRLDTYDDADHRFLALATRA